MANIREDKRRLARAVYNFATAGAQTGGAFVRKPARPWLELLSATKCPECEPGPLQLGAGPAALADFFDPSAALMKVPRIEK